jgi:DNA-binding GntR family transcriptional regulator
MNAVSTTKGRRLKRSARTAERIFNRLVEAIVTGALEGGQPVREAGLAKQWGVSRTPMREAVRRVAEGGLIILRRNRAPLVRAFTSHDIDCLYRMREVLEALALEEAWEHIPPGVVTSLRELGARTAPDGGKDWIARCLTFDDVLHRAWIDHCQNPWLRQSLQRIWTYIRIFQRVVARNPKLVRRSYQEHLAILQTLGTPQRRAGAALLRRHVRNSGSALKARLETA